MTRTASLLAAAAALLALTACGPDTTDTAGQAATRAGGPPDIIAAGQACETLGATPMENNIADVVTAGEPAAFTCLLDELNASPLVRDNLFTKVDGEAHAIVSNGIHWQYTHVSGNPAWPGLAINYADDVTGVAVRADTLTED